jgi:hypothetical protein
MQQCAASLELLHTSGGVLDEYEAMIEQLAGENGRNAEQKSTSLPLCPS